MRIVIDLQGAQGSNRLRGIGRYTLSVAKAILRNSGEHEVLLALNGLFPETIEPIRSDFYDLLPQNNIRCWSAPGPVSNLSADNDWRRMSAELVRESFLASLKPDIVLVTSLFEGLGDDVVTSISSLSLNVPTATILYDLIPFIHRRPYLENPVVEAWYERKLDHLRRSDYLLAISESSRQEGIRYLGFSEDVSVNISTAVDPQFKSQSISRKHEIGIRERYKLLRSFVMYTGGIDHRKNIEGLIRAYASLPKALRAQHQLAVVCAIQPLDITRLEDLAKKCQLKKDELVLTGFIPEDDLLDLYGLCKLFVFPSWHEGFGLPALEAMACGKAVIGANTSSIPEVIGRKDALFDPKNDEAIAEKLKQVLTDDTFRLELERHGLIQAKQFSWDKSARLALAGLEKLHSEHQQRMAIKPSPVHRPKMAYISPLPPERSGISDYSAELLPELSRHYDIDVIVAQVSISTPWINANCQIRTSEWFRQNSDRYDRVIYHFGNSHFHQHMFSLLEDVPGVVVLHDFFLSGIVAHMDVNGFNPNGWANELYQAHGYKAVQERYHATDTADVIWKYPCNLSVLTDALGVIVHSENSQRLAKCWYAPNEADDWAVIPHLRVPVLECDRAKARDTLKLNADDFVICSFGLLGPTKLNHRLLAGWLASSLAKDKHCVLVFVGENQTGEYGQELLTTIRRSGLKKRIRITGWADVKTFRHYLAAADIAVQLRTLSRGETSGTVLDCMNYGLPSIVNANGSMADLPDDVVWKLPDDFNDVQLIEALEKLSCDERRREKLGARAREVILEHHAPRTCAEQYLLSIETFYRNTASNSRSLTRAVAAIEPGPANPEELLPLAEAIAQTISPQLAPRQLLVDVSELVQRDSKSGIQRVVRGILSELLSCPPEGLRVEPVYAASECGYRYARHFTLGFLDCPTDTLDDELVEYRPGDIFLGLDLQPQIVQEQRGFYQRLRCHGVKVHFVVYDLLCILMPQYFIDGAAEGFRRWLEVVAESDGVVCISMAVANEVDDWVKKYGQKRARPFKISWFHLGADVENTMPSLGMPMDGNKSLELLSDRVSFLMVGTIEPRKGHAQTLAAFEQLWVENVDVNLVIVGKQGWMVEKLIQRLVQHPELGKRLFWLDGISDEYLKKVYAASTCLIAASEGEGFGLPLIEAAQQKLAIIARDIPTFCEVAGENASYFRGLEPVNLVQAIKGWLELFETNQAPSSESLHWQTWKESTKQLLEEVCK
jgi:glycosyltransferase involved in cell wall biosynthesis